ncbi:MAG: hypothetical protein LBB88_08410 [Planctomycetaceae bacterium]|nr:hypothetical protein [Planctomycetaceae bacterium]
MGGHWGQRGLMGHWGHRCLKSEINDSTQKKSLLSHFKQIFNQNVL